MTTKILTTMFALLLLAAWPVLAQEAGPAGQMGEGQAGQQGAGPEAGGVPPSGLQADDEAAPVVQQEDAARTETPSVRGAETTPEAGVQQAGAQPGQTGAVADPGQDPAQTSVTERAGVETERETTIGLEDEPAGGAMPTTSSALPMLMGLGAALAVAGLALRLSARSR